MKLIVLIYFFVNLTVFERYPDISPLDNCPRTIAPMKSPQDNCPRIVTPD